MSRTPRPHVRELSLAVGAGGGTYGGTYGGNIFNKHQTKEYTYMSRQCLKHCIAKNSHTLEECLKHSSNSKCIRKHKQGNRECFALCQENTFRSRVGQENALHMEAAERSLGEQPEVVSQPYRENTFRSRIGQENALQMEAAENSLNSRVEQ